MGWYGIIKYIDEEIVTDIPGEILNYSSNRSLRNLIGLPGFRYRHGEIIRHQIITCLQHHWPSGKGGQNLYAAQVRR